MLFLSRDISSPLSLLVQKSGRVSQTVTGKVPDLAVPLDGFLYRVGWGDSDRESTPRLNSLSKTAREFSVWMGFWLDHSRPSSSFDEDYLFFMSHQESSKEEGDRAG